MKHPPDVTEPAEARDQVAGSGKANKRSQRTPKRANGPLSLDEAALAKLKESDLDEADAHRFGITMSVDNGMALDALDLPYFEPTARVEAMMFVDAKGTYQPFFRRRKLGKLATGENKYWQPEGSSVRAYFARGVEWLRILADATIPLILTEGELKALCAIKHDFLTVGLGGVNSGVVDGRLIPDLLRLNLDGRLVRIAFDAEENADVLSAQWTLVLALRERGATVKIVNLPLNRFGKKKVALDDYLVEYGAEELQKLLDEASDPKPFLALRDRDHLVHLPTIVAALAERGGLYNRGGELVRVVEVREALAQGLTLSGSEALAIARDESQPVIIACTSDYLRVAVGAAVDLARYDGRARRLVRLDCPPDLARALLALGTWPGIPPLRAISRAPFLRSDGTLCIDPGYDVATATLLYPNIQVSVPGQPTRQDALSALADLCAPFDEVAWAESEPAGVYAAAFLAYQFTLATRPILPVAPVFIFVAPEAGTGKTLLADCGALIVHGTAPAKRSYPTEEDERRKVLHAAVLAGDPVLLFDNVRPGTAVGGEALNMYATAEVAADRVLGESRAPRVPMAAVIAVTGNNIGATADFVRRALVARLDANVERPEARAFKIPDLRAYVRKHRAKLLGAVLTILRAFIIAGAPRLSKRPPLGSFEAWDRLVPGCLTWLGLPDPVRTQDELRDSDEEHELAVALFTELHKRFAKTKTKTFTVREAQQTQSGDSLLPLLIRIEGGAEKLAYWLRKHHNQVRGGLKLKKPTKHNDGRWMLVEVDR